MQLSNIIQYKGQIELLSGLHIGSGDAEMKIGGIDSTVIKHPFTNEPYIPGSSLKGKMRHLLEWTHGAIYDHGKPVGYKDYQNESGERKEKIKLIMQLFGVSGDSNNDSIGKEIGSTRLSFWDCMLVSNWKKERDERNQLMTESKSENSINRITGTADSPRFIERVPSGTVFNFSLNMKITSTDDKEELQEMLLKGLKLLEMDAIGSSGSRGYGKIKFKNLKENDNDIQAKLDEYNVFN